jgi:hypothetical protein
MTTRPTPPRGFDRWQPDSTFTRCPACGAGIWAYPLSTIACAGCGVVGKIEFFGKWIIQGRTPAPTQEDLPL